MLTEAIQQLAGLFSRRFFFNALLPTFIFLTCIIAVAWMRVFTTSEISRLWETSDLLSRILWVFVYVAVVYFVAAAVASQWRNIVRLYEGYPLRRMRSARVRRLLGLGWHSDRHRQLLGEDGDESQAYYRYPSEEFTGDLLPTRLGNILLAGERYADSRYGVDTIYFWPRLYPLLPPTLKADLEQAAIQYQFPLVVSFQAAISTAICSGILLVTGAPPLAFLVCLFGGTALAHLAYLLSLSSATELAELQRTAFDLHRGSLLLAWPSVADVEDENSAFAQIKGFVVFGAEPSWNDPHDSYLSRHRPASQGGE